MKKSIFYLFTLFAFFSCNTNEYIENDEEADWSNDTNFVDMREAVAIASLMEFDFEDPNGLRSTTYKNVQKTTPMGSTAKPSYYIVNYEDNSGFAIISADKRTEVVLAYSDENSFDTEISNMPGGLVQWLAGTDEYIQDIREGVIEEVAELRRSRLCYALKSASLRAALPPRDECITGSGCPADSYSTVIKGPLLTTKWHQGTGFNNLVPVICGSGRGLAGCVAIAVGQVMYYHKYPSSFNWDSMNPEIGGNEASRLIVELGKSNNLNTSYGCSNSSADWGVMAKTFKNYGYSSSITSKNYTSGDSNLIYSEISAGRPVILGAQGTGGHMWVCDGYQRSNSCTHSTYALHMNWGTYKGEYIGWYADTWNPGNSNYYKDRKILYSIKP